MGLWTDAMLVMNPAQLIQIVAVQGFALAIVMATNLAKQLPERRRQHPNLHLIQSQLALLQQHPSQNIYRVLRIQCQVLLPFLIWKI